MTLSTKLLSAAALGLSLVATATSQAAVYYNGWNYAIDSQTDGSPSSGGIYEYRGLAYRVLGDRIIFGYSSQMPQGGNAVGAALNGRVNHGELFLNFSAHNLDTPAEFSDPLVFAVRWDPLNDSLGNVSGSNITTGLFGGVTASSLTLANTGWGTLASYASGGWGRTTDAMADLEDNISVAGDVRNYLGGGTQYPNIASGNRLGDITMLSRTDLAGMGLDFSHFSADPGGNSIWGFSLAASLLPQGSFMAHQFEECMNDGMAIQGEVPEPGALAIAGTFAGVGLFMLRRLRRA